MSNRANISEEIRQFEKLYAAHLTPVYRYAYLFTIARNKFDRQLTR